jgi:hypothetical protein
MGFPLSLADVWKVFEFAQGRKAESKAAVCGWLDSVYTDLEDLWKVWFRICERLDDANEKHEITEALKIIRRGELGFSQCAFAGRLRNFYKSASIVLGSNHADFRDDFVDTLGELLQERDRARSMLDEVLPTTTLASVNTDETLLKMREQAEAIQREVVSLQVLIKTFKAQS